MGEYEPHDSRNVAQKQGPGDPGKQTGWRQSEAAIPTEPYEPVDSRHVTAGQEQGGGEPGEGTWRQQEAAEGALQQHGETGLDRGGELMEDGRGEDAEQVPDPQAEQSLREEAMERDADELDDEAGSLDRND